MCCKPLVPSYGNAAQGRAGVKVTTAIRKVCSNGPRAADHGFRASPCGDGDWASWLHVGLSTLRRLSPQRGFRGPETCLQPWEVAEPRGHPNPRQQQGGSPRRQTAPMPTEWRGERVRVSAAHTHQACCRPGRRQQDQRFSLWSVLLAHTSASPGLGGGPTRVET